MLNNKLLKIQIKEKADKFIQASGLIQLLIPLQIKAEILISVHRFRY
jgi:hypothetical protein